MKKTVLVVGATGGIGSSLSRYFFTMGARVMLSSRTERTLRELQESLGVGSITQTRVLPCDATKIIEVDKLFLKLKESECLPDIIVVSTGKWEQLSLKSNIGEAETRPVEDMEKFFLPIFNIGFLAYKYALAHSKKIFLVHIGSHAAVRTDLPGNLAYGSMKAAARHFLFSMAEEAADAKLIKVVDIQPAIVNTDGNAHLLKNERAKAAAVQPQDIAAWIEKHCDDLEIPREVEFRSDIVV